LYLFCGGGGGGDRSHEGLGGELMNLWSCWMGVVMKRKRRKNQKNPY
jgi:hypothetical protein